MSGPSTSRIQELLKPSDTDIAKEVKLMLKEIRGNLTLTNNVRLMGEDDLLMKKRFEAAQKIIEKIGLDKDPALLALIQNCEASDNPQDILQFITQLENLNVDERKPVAVPFKKAHDWIVGFNDTHFPGQSAPRFAAPRPAEAAPLAVQLLNFFWGCVTALFSSATNPNKKNPAESLGPAAPKETSTAPEPKKGPHDEPNQGVVRPFEVDSSNSNASSTNRGPRS